jgi:hypothetical protein
MLVNATFISYQIVKFNILLKNEFKLFFFLYSAHFPCGRKIPCSIKTASISGFPLISSMPFFNKRKQKTQIGYKILKILTNITETMSVYEIKASAA